MVERVSLNRIIRTKLADGRLPQNSIPRDAERLAPGGT